MELTGLISWLKFDKSPTDDFVNNNNWQVFGNPTIGPDNAINGNALQLDGNSYLKLSGVNFGGKTFAIDGWAYVDQNSPDLAKLISIVNPSNGYYLLALRKSEDDSSKLGLWLNSNDDIAQDGGRTINTNAASVGERVHFRISTGTSFGWPIVRLSINGSEQGYLFIGNGYARRDYDIYIGANPSGGQGLIGSIDEICIYNAKSFSSDYTPPTANYYNSGTLTAKSDTKRIIKNPLLTWRYENLGTADLLTQSGTTVTNLDESQSKTGRAFYQPTQSKCFDIPNCKEIWIKCDIYTTANYSGSDRIRIYDINSNNQANGWSTGSSATSNYLLWHNGTSESGSSSLAKNKLRPILLHMVSDSTNGIVEYFFASGDTDKFTGNVNNGDDFANVYIQMDGSNILVSNLIISNAPLDIDDDVRQKAVEFTADTTRILKNIVEISSDAKRNIVKSAAINFSANRDVVKSFDFNFDSERQIANTENLLGDTTRFIKNAVENLSDTKRNIIKSAEINFSLCRDIVKSLQITTDTKREICRSLELFFGTVREVTSANLTPFEKYFDVVRNITNAVAVSNDTERNIVQAANLLNDTERKIVFAVSCNFDTRRKTFKSIIVFINTERLTANLVAVNFDTLRHLGIWRYEDYGLAGRARTYVEKSKSKYAIANKGYVFADDFPDFPQTNEVWIKFDIYTEFHEGTYKPRSDMPLDNLSFSVGYDAYSVDYDLDTASWANLSVTFGESSGSINVRSSSQDFGTHENLWVSNILHSCLFHMKAGINDGVIEFWIDGQKVINYSGNLADGNDFKGLYLRGYCDKNSSNYALFSNVIISNKEIGFNENTKMPIAAYYDTERKTSADAEVIVSNNWRYEDYSGVGLLALDTDTVAVDFDKSKYGAGFYQTQDTNVFNIPATNELWLKFDFYIENIAEMGRYKEYWGLRLKDNSSGFSLFVIASNSGNGYDIDFINPNSDSTSNIGDGYKYELSDLSTCLIHMKSGNPEGLIEVWFNGELKGSIISNVNNGEDFENICLTAWTGQYYFRDPKEILFSNVIISNKEIGLSENCKVPVESVLDTKRLLISLWNGATWRYENYGTTELISLISTEVKCEKSKSVYYQGFCQSSRLRCFDIPAEKEIWAKFDVYTTLSKRWRAYHEISSEKVVGICSQTNGNLDFWAQENQVVICNGVVKNQRQTVLLHMVSDSTNGVIEAWLDGSLLNTYTGSVNNGEDFNNFYLQSDGEDTFFSNVIISNNQIGLNENAKMIFASNYDLQRNITNPIISSLDVTRNVVKSQIIYASTIREAFYFIELFNDTCRDTVSAVRVKFDTARSIPHRIRVMPIPVIDFSTTQKLKVKKFSLLADNPSIVINPSTDDITEGTQSIEISLTAQQLTDQISYTGVNPAAIMEEVQGQYLDHIFDVRIEKISRRGALYSWKCCTDIDEILYRQLDYQIPDDERWHRTDNNPDNDIYDYIPMSNASVHISHIAENMGKQPMLFFADFVSTVDVNAGGVTYNDLISSIFGWTSRLPCMLINVFIRGDKLFVVQRGHEPNTIDLTDTKHTLPNVDCELIRTAWGANTWSETETREKRGNLVLDHYEFESGAGAGNSEESDRADGYTYGDDGLVTQSEKTEGDTVTTTYYEYTTLKGGRKVLSTERTVIYEKGTLTDEIITHHTYLGQGQSHSTTYDSDGDYMGGSVGQSTGDDRVSPLTTNKAFGWYIYDENGNKKYIKSRTMKYETIPEERKIYGITLFDTSFPVHGDDALAGITATINWLNRRTQETVSMSIYDYPHLIDFTDKIVFEGNEYFLVSNTATTTPRIINRQDVTFMRWF